MRRVIFIWKVPSPLPLKVPLQYQKYSISFTSVSIENPLVERGQGILDTLRVLWVL